MNKNPFQYNCFHHYFLTFKELENNSSAKILDYGSGEGEFIGKLSKKSKLLYGFDVDCKMIKKASKKYSKVNFKCGKIGDKLPYPNNYFDVVFMFHVLEHVDSEERSIREVVRVLKKRGIFFLASPYKGLFSWADTANLRYKFPMLHKYLVLLLWGRKKYEELFVKNKEIGLYSNSSINRNWHKHYKEREIVELLKGKFLVKEFTKFSLFQPFLLILINLWVVVFKKENKFLERLVRIDNELRLGELSYNMLVRAVKK